MSTLDIPINDIDYESLFGGFDVVPDNNVKKIKTNEFVFPLQLIIRFC